MMFNDDENQDNYKQTMWRIKLAIGAVILVIILVLCLIFKAIAALAIVFTCIPYIAFLVFSSMGSKLQRRVWLSGLNNKLSEMGKILVIKWTATFSVIVILLSVAQFLLNPSYIPLGLLGIVFCVYSIFRYMSSRYKLGLLRQNPLEALKNGFNKNAEDNYVKSKKSKTKKQNKNKNEQEFILIECNNCGQRSRIPGNKGKLMVTCPKCGNTSEVEP